MGVHHLALHGGLLSAGRSGCLFLLALILELQTTKVNIQIMDILAAETNKICEIFTKISGFFMLISQFANIWYHKIFWKELEEDGKRRFTNAAVSVTIVAQSRRGGHPP